MREAIRQIPLAKPVYRHFKKSAKQVYRHFKEKEYKRKFATDGYSCFWGVFETFEQAKQAAPPTKTVGYDNAELAQEYRQMLEQDNWENSGRVIASFDYPVLFWLKAAFSEGCTQVFDFGGNVGTHYYSYSKYLEYPESLKWKICEVPEIAKVGRELAEHRAVEALDFTTDFNDSHGADIFISSGAIQYVENLAHALSLLKEKPKHILINRLPLYNGEQFVTLQNGGKVFYPQYVFNQDEFIGGLQNLGYELVDIWDDRVDSCAIPFQPDRLVPFYSGLYLKLNLA